MDEVPFQALYRRHRPRRFAEVRGQDHITRALRNAVAAGRVGHAYLFSGPRGTGKTSTARILAAALNCAHPDAGEPDTICESCVAIQTGASLDVMELDAASNNGVDAMRDLVARAALGSPGRWKVYIVDEVHMLTTGASNALLKTLEEPPGHVVFVLATTDDQKVLPTIKSRTQHYHFRLLGPEVLSSLVAELNELDSLGLDPTTLDRVVRRGNGSARDALSALDQAAAAGVAEDEHDVIPDLVEALIAKDAGAALVAVAQAAARGRDPQRLAVELVEHLRAGFLLVMAPEVSGVPEQQRPPIEDHARRLGTPATVRAMEVLGETLVEMRESLDVRVTLELALVRLCSPAADHSPGAILERLEALERRGGSPTTGGGAPTRRGEPTADSTPPASTSREQPSPAVAGATSRSGDQTSGVAGPPQRSGERPSSGGGPPWSERHDEPPPPPPPPTPPPVVGPRRTLGAVRREQDGGPRGQSVLTLDRDELTKVWGDRIFGGLSTRTRAAFRDGRWIQAGEGRARFAFGASTPRVAVETQLGEVEAALTDHFGTVVQVLVEPDGPAAAVAPEPEEHVSAAEFATLETAPDAPTSMTERLLQAFPGTEEVT